MELTLSQIAILGLLVTVITQAIKWGVVWFKVQEVNKTVLSLVVFVISTGVAMIWVKPTLLINWDDPVAMISALLLAATAVFGMAKLIYEFLLGKILDAISTRLNVPLNTASILERKFPPLGPG